MKYTLNCYGWSGDFIGQKISYDQIDGIKEIMEKKGVSDPTDVISNMDEVGIDPFYGDILDFTRPLDNETMHFELLDENGVEVLTFYITDIATIEEVDENYSPSDGYDLYPDEDTNIFFVVYESKGGIYSFEIESDTIPTIEDFNYDQNVISTPDTDWDVIEGIYFKNEKLEIYEMLDNDGKATTVQIHWF